MRVRSAQITMASALLVSSSMQAGCGADHTWISSDGGEYYGYGNVQLSTDWELVDDNSKAVLYVTTRFWGKELEGGQSYSTWYESTFGYEDLDKVSSKFDFWQDEIRFGYATVDGIPENPYEKGYDLSRSFIYDESDFGFEAQATQIWTS